MARTKLVRVQEDGQISVPVELRKKLNLKKGDLVAVIETPDGLLLASEKVLLNEAFDRLGAILREEGVTLDEMLDSGAEIREELTREQYGDLRASS
jgi:AbrB family looped-hinge helix DNA binding protein